MVKEIEGFSAKTAISPKIAKIGESAEFAKITKFKCERIEVERRPAKSAISAIMTS